MDDLRKDAHRIRNKESEAHKEWAQAFSSKGRMKCTMNTDSTPAVQQMGIWAAIIAPILFTISVIVESVLRSGYSQIYNYISELGVGPYAIIQIASFIVFGLLLLVFG